MNVAGIRCSACAAVASLALCAFPACASDAQRTLTGVRADVGADVGTGWNILTIPAAAFNPMGGATYRHQGFGYLFNSGLETPEFWAPVFLPSGAGIGSLGLYAWDNNASGTVHAHLVRYTGIGSYCPSGSLCIPGAPPSGETIATVETSGSIGHVYVPSNPLFPLHTVNNNVPSGGGFYAVLVFFAGFDDLAWKGVDIWWKRQISLAPGTASFTDVPTNAHFFAEIEAMKAAGITAGCTATHFCPESTVTRRQMAAFLARALGLYWQY